MQKVLKREEVANHISAEDQLHLSGSYEVSWPQSQKVIPREVYTAMKEAKDIIEEARLEALKIKQEAQRILDRVHEDQEQAKQLGYTEGKREGGSQVAELLIQANHQKEKMFEGIEKDSLALIYDIAEKIIGIELKEREEALIDLIKQALHSALGQKIMVIVNPADLEILKKYQPSLMQSLDVSKSLQIRSDEKVSPKGCFIETEIGTIDAQLDTQLNIIKKTLGIEDKKESHHE